MSKKTIITINGEELLICKAKKFSKGYYKIGDVNIENSGDCYKINDKFYRFETGQVVFNHSIEQYQLLDFNLIYGLIKNNKKGYFNKQEKNKIPIIFENHTRSFAINEEVLNENLLYREQLSTGVFVHISLLRANEFLEILKPKHEYKSSLPYDSKGITNKHSEMYDYLYKTNTNHYSDNLGDILGDLTFGLEFETTAGFVPERITKRLGLIPLRDGSISGIEYVTIPLTGSKGIQTIVDVSKELNKRTIFDNSCALHLHIGNIPRTPEFILAFIKLNSFLQNDIFSLFPLYKKYNLGIKNKNYSKPYDLFSIFNLLDPVINSKNINKNFDVLISKLTNNQCDYNSYAYNMDNIDYHPLDPTGNQKWNISERYYFYNLIPLIFGNKQTIEFRIHTPTFNYYKIIMFLFLNSLLIKFTIKYHQQILEDPSFFNKKFSNIDNKLTSFLEGLNYNEIGNSSLVSIFIKDLSKYLRNRRNISEFLTVCGKIEYKEEEIITENTLEFDSFENCSKTKECKSNKYLEEINTYVLNG